MGRSISELALLYLIPFAAYVLYIALRRVYMQLKRYDDAIALMEQRLRLQPTDVNILAQLGRAA